MLQNNRHQENHNAISRPIRTYFTRWLIRTNSYDLTRTILYDLSKPQWLVGLGAGLGVGHSYELCNSYDLAKIVWICTSEVVRICTN